MTSSQPIPNPSSTYKRRSDGWHRVLPFLGRTRNAWQGRTAVVCGGSQGLGLAIAEELVCQNVEHLILIARNPGNLMKAAEYLRTRAIGPAPETAPTAGINSISPRITPITADLTDIQSSQSAMKEIQLATTTIDLVIQAVGSSDRGTIMGLSRQRLIELVEDNLVTSLHTIQQFSPLMEATGGVIVLIGSLSSLFAPRFLGGYSIAKHGLVALAQQARMELAGKNVHVTLCCPGPIARPDAGFRYSEKIHGVELPADAQLPGGGAKVKGLNQERLSREILRAAWRRDLLMIRPQKAWWLRLVSQLFPSLGERILRRKTS